LSNIEYAGFLFNDAGTAIPSAAVTLFDKNATTTALETTTTNSSGYWAISRSPDSDGTDDGDIQIVSGDSVRRLKYDDAIQVKEVEVADFHIRNPADTYTYDIVPTAITADRQLNLPLIGATRTLIANDTAIADSENILLGTGGDATIDYDGSDLVISTAVVGSGDLVITGGSAEFNDAEGVRFGTGKDTEIRWSTGDSSNHALTVGLGDSNQALHITDLAAIATDWNIAATTHPNVYVHSNTTPATDYLRLGDHDGTTAYIDVVGGTTLALEIAGNTELTVTASGLNVPANSDINFTGTTGTNDIVLTNALADALSITDGSADIVVIDTNTAGNVTTFTSALTVGVNDTGHDVKLFGATAGQYLLWDESADELVLAGDTKLSFHDAAGGENIIASANGHLEVNAGTTLDITAPTVDLNSSTEFNIDTAAYDLNASGAVTVDSAGISLDSSAASNFTTSGGALTITSAAAATWTVGGGNLTLDVTGDIALSADGGNVTMDDGATTIFDFDVDGTALTIHDDQDTGDTAVITIAQHGALSIVTTDDDAAAANIQITADGTAELAGTTVTLDSAVDIELEATNDINVPASVGLTFGDDGEKIEGDGTNLVVESSGTLDMNSGGVLTLDSGAAINLEPASGSAILLDGTISIDGGAVTGVASIFETDIKIGEDDQTKIDFETANTINFYANNAKDLVLSENALTPGTSDGTALGTTSLMWSDLFLASGSVVNFNNGDVTLTHGSNLLTITGLNELDITNASSTSDMLLTVENSTNTSNSDASVAVVVGGTSAGDPKVTWTVTGGSSWTMGADNSSNDAFQLVSGTGLGGDRLFVTDGRTSGAVYVTRFNLHDDLNFTATDNASAGISQLGVGALTLTLSGTTDGTGVKRFNNFGQLSIIQSGGAVSVAHYANVGATAPRPGTDSVGANITLDNTSAFYVLDVGSIHAEATLTNQHGLFVAALTNGATSNSQITLQTGTTPTVEVADLVQMAAVDIAGGDARLLIVGESASAPIYIGNDTIRIDLPIAAGATNISLDENNELQQDTSARRWKDNIEHLEFRHILTALRPREFDWREGVSTSGLRLEGRHDLGFIAEEAFEVDPRLASWNSDGKITDVRYKLISAPLVAGWQDHEMEIEALKARLAALEDRGVAV